MGQHLENFEDYTEKRRQVQDDVVDWIGHFGHVQADAFHPQLELTKHVTKVLINPEKKDRQVYFTVHGSAADTGDVGVVGRGNRLNGLITPMRSMSIEAPAGKNPIDHTGKLHGLVAWRIAQALHQRLNQRITVNIFTRKASLITNPDEIVVGCEHLDGDLERLAGPIIEDHLTNIGKLSRSMIDPGVTMW